MSGPAVQASLFGDLAEPPRMPSASLEERYRAWIALNGWVLEAIESLADEAIGDGATKLGIGHLVEILRWRHRRSTKGDTFYINNSYRSRMVRDLIERRPDLEPFFETRELRS
jgi:hypothetical protein